MSSPAKRASVIVSMPKPGSLVLDLVDRGVGVSGFGGGRPGVVEPGFDPAQRDQFDHFHVIDQRAGPGDQVLVRLVFERGLDRCLVDPGFGHPDRVRIEDGLMNLVLEASLEGTVRFGGFEQDVGEFTSLAGLRGRLCVAGNLLLIGHAPTLPGQTGNGGIRSGTVVALVR